MLACIFAFARIALVPIAIATTAMACNAGRGDAAAPRPMPGMGVNQGDYSFCQLEQQQRAACSPAYPVSTTPDEQERCVKSSCVDRHLFGDEVIAAQQACNLRRSCSSGKDGCAMATIGAQASSPRALAAFQHCSGFLRRCGPLRGTHGKDYGCDVYAVFGEDFQASLARCLDMPCELAAMCTQEAIARVEVACSR